MKKKKSLLAAIVSLLLDLIMFEQIDSVTKLAEVSEYQQAIPVKIKTCHT
jgi:hypothetical protein